MRFEEQLLDLLPRLRRFAHALARDAADADDLLQASVERALLRRDQWQPGTRLDSWMARLMRNLWIDTVRAQTRRGETFVPPDAGESVGVGASQEAMVELGNVGRAMRTLPPEQREAVALVVVEGFAYREAAEILEIPIGTLTSRLVRGREALMAKLGEAA
ncbi:MULTISPECIES: RNA polymerase sigma factor [unclassified Sphingomonas]|uniref:RNA polymerase sigma factor n=1 Tax=unclassified Sphingomonas TaxID=196159 RepID=UPI002151FC9A|nr:MULTISPECIES: sigma-70 family RNA polymerase sigma factor [unclassified Sphingomonas]MCR5870631.1 sigma-70 family RNA polymerase sigma factor [Sphingomonas sp. J344]UUY01026.1 sigma-70 family RNA polymerase sigma factor [Sphingomonas sp. J315]